MVRIKQFSVAILVVLTAMTTIALRADQEEGSGDGGGVPAGAIIGWLPPEEGAGIPDGWMVCSRANRSRYGWVPDLSTNGKFLRGAESPYPGSEDFDGGWVGGSPQHSHTTARRTIEQRQLERRTSGDRAASERHQHVTDAQSHLPPHVRVIFLCKCRSSDCSSG